MSSTASGRCEATKANGERCRAYAIRDSRFCYWHAPETLEQRQEARSRGGRARHGRRLDVVDGREFKSLADMVEMLSEAVRATLGLENSVRRNRALGYLARAWADVYEVGELEGRLERLEEEVAQ